MNLGLSLGLASGGRAATVPQSLGADVIGWWDGARTVNMTRDGDDVARITSLGAGPAMAPPWEVTGRAPSYASSVLTFDGSADILVSELPLGSTSLTSGTTWADTPGCDTGKGPTCTGLAIGPNGERIVGVDGRPNSGSSSFADSGVAIYLADGSLRDVYLADSYTAGTLGSTQGVCYIPGENAVAFMHLGDNTIYVIDFDDGTLIRSISLGVLRNGLAYDSDLGQFIVNTNAGSMEWRHLTTGAVVSYAKTPHSVDHVHYDAANQEILLTYGANGRDGRVTALDVTTRLPKHEWHMPGAKAIEGVVRSGNQLLICDDGHFHSYGDSLNRLLTFDITSTPSPTPDVGSRFLVAGICKIAAAPGSTVCLMQIGDPLDNEAFPGGFGVYFISGSSAAFRIIASDGAGAGNRSTADIATTVTTTFLYALDVDYANSQVTAYVNGAQVGAVRALANISGGLKNPWARLGAAQEGGVFTRFSAVSVSSCCIVKNGHNNRQLIEGALAWYAGQEALLPSGHPYKTAAP